MEQAAAEPIAALLEEANDLTFGSTLNEQAKFTERLASWVSAVFPTAAPPPGGDGEGHGGTGWSDASVKPMFLDPLGEDHCWETLFAILQCVATWIPKLCLSMHLQVIAALLAPTRPRPMRRPPSIWHYRMA